MAKKIIKKAVKEVAKIARGRGRPKGSTNKPKAAAPKVKAAPPSPSVSRTPAAQRRADQRKTRAERSAKPKGPTPLTRTPAAQKRRSQRAARPTTTASKGTAPLPVAPKMNPRFKDRKEISRGKELGIVSAVGAAPGVIGLGVLAASRKSNSGKDEGTFGDAFKAARKKGEGTKFTYKGKQYSAVTKDDLKKKGYDANELKQYMNKKGKARGPLNRLGQKAKKVLLGKDKKFGGDKGAIDFIRTRKKKPTTKKAGGMANSKPKKFKAGGMATKGLGKAYMKSKR